MPEMSAPRTTLAGMVPSHITLLHVTRSPELRDEVARLAAATGVEPVFVDQPAQVLPHWSAAPLVLVGVDVADEVAALAPPRRAGVHLLGLFLHDDAFRSAVSLGAESVMALPDGADAVSRLLADAGEPRARGRLVGVLSGSGGVGATTLACALAQAAAERGPTLLVDADPLGPGADRLLGLDRAAGVRWGDLHATSGRLGSRALRETVPRDRELGVLAWSAGHRRLDPEAVRQGLAAARRGHDLVVLDLPRSDDRLTTELVGRCDQVLVVCRSSVAGVAATSRVVEALGVPHRRAGLVLRRGRVLPEDIEAVTGIPVLAEVGDQRGLSDALDLGVGPPVGRRSPLGRAVRQLLRPVRESAA